MATIVYLDAEDEITSAAARIRAAADSRVGLVLPFGSRVATSRINFRLLAREAMSHGRRLDIVAPDASARALAASAGLPVFASVGEYEEALDTEDEEKDARRAASRAAAGLAGGAAVAGSAAVAGGTASAAPADPRGATAAAPTGGADPNSGSVRSSGAKARGGSSARPAAAGAAAAAAGAADLSDTDLYDAPGAVGASTTRSPDALPVAQGRRRGRRLGAIIGTLLVLVVVVGAVGVGAYLLLPSASITVTPRIEDLGPVTFKVHADPTATSVDEAAGVVPAVTLTVPVETQSDFPATGKRVEKHPAKGAVKWTNCDPTSPYRIPSGTVVKTASGTAFTTDEEVFLPVAILSGGGASPSLDCQSSEVSVTADVPGPDGNVDAGTIRVVPPRYNSNVLRVNNPAPTTRRHARGVHPGLAEGRRRRAGQAGRGPPGPVRDRGPASERRPRGHHAVPRDRRARRVDAVGRSADARRPGGRLVHARAVRGWDGPGGGRLAGARPSASSASRRRSPRVASSCRARRASRSGTGPSSTAGSSSR